MTDRPSKAFIVHLDNGKKFALSFNKSGEMVVMFGKYKDVQKQNFEIVHIKTFGNEIGSKYTNDQLLERETIKKLIAPFINDLKRRSEKINGL
jgi:hypothetical protein